MVGCHTKGLGDVLQGSGTGGDYISVGDEGADPPARDGPWESSNMGLKGG